MAAESMQDEEWHLKAITMVCVWDSTIKADSP